MMERRKMAKAPHAPTSKRQRVRLLGVNMSSLYTQRNPCSDEAVTLMNELADLYAVHPFKGYRRLTWDLRDQGYIINTKRVLGLMRSMGLAAVYPKKNLSKRRHDHAVFPYLLKDHPPFEVHDGWCVDITYIKIAKGYVYLTALIDVVSRHVMGWCLSTHLDTSSCLEALDMALRTGYKPRIINSDQGCQFTSAAWVDALKEVGIAISMDGKGRCLDNVYIERFWRSIKYEEVYLKSYESVVEARKSLGDYIVWYNIKRRHQSLGYKRPHEVMMSGCGQNTVKEPDGCVDKHVVLLVSENTSRGLPTKSTGFTTTPAFSTQHQAVKMN